MGNAIYLQTPQLPPSFAQCLQYLQFLQALQEALPVQVATDLLEEYASKVVVNIRTEQVSTIICFIAKFWFRSTNYFGE